MIMEDHPEIWKPEKAAFLPVPERAKGVLSFLSTTKKIYLANKELFQKAMR
jgi:hypothetical protein